MTKPNSKLSALHAVKPGDTMESLSKFYYGEEGHEHAIAHANGISPTAILVLGKRLKIPARDADLGAIEEGGFTGETNVPTQTLPDGTVVALETLAPVEVIAAQKWYENWKLWAALLGAGLAWYLLSNRRK